MVSEQSKKTANKRSKKKKAQGKKGAKASTNKRATKKTKKTKKSRKSKKSKSTKKTGSKSAAKGGPPTFRRRLVNCSLLLVLLTVLGVFAYALYLDRQISGEFVGQPWQNPARVYARAVDLYAGKSVSPNELENHLQTLGYKNVEQPAQSGEYTRRNRRLRVIVRSVAANNEQKTPIAVDVSFDAEGIVQLRDGRGSDLPLVYLDPLLIGSVIPSNGQDRMVIGADQVPSLLPAALKAVEDRKFETHWGLDPKGILRAAWVNLRAGGVEQGGSTITQQLVKSHFLSNEQTWSRKFKEALMALSLDARMEKNDIMLAYINEIYLGQEGNRAIHGFDLASRFYFGRELNQLEVHQLAALVGLVRGPSLYNPRRFPERALKRRNQVLALLIEQQVLSPEAGAEAQQQSLDILSQSAQRNSKYPAFLSMVKRQLLEDYDRQDLTSNGLTIATTLDVLAQNKISAAVTNSLERVEAQAKVNPGELQTAAAVLSPDTGELIALVGSRDAGFDGFNRAVDMRRPIGSLIKPFVFLTAVESGRWDLNSIISNQAITLTLDNGKTWSPRNFSDVYTKEEPMFRVLSQSLNVPTVRIGDDLGVSQVANTIERLGFTRTIEPFPSLFLGSIEMSPVEVAQLYLGLSSGGFAMPIRVVTEVSTAQGQALKRYPLQLSEQLDPKATFQIVENMKMVMTHGTARRSTWLLPRKLSTAGKTGSTNDLRDSWFAGFSQDTVSVVWVGADDNRSIGLTGSQAALPVWAEIMKNHSQTGLDSFAPSDLNWVPFDYVSGLNASDCFDSVLVPLRSQTSSPVTCNAQ